jgi:hypothetical protein
LCLGEWSVPVNTPANSTWRQQVLVSTPTGAVVMGVFAK